MEPVERNINEENILLLQELEINKRTFNYGLKTRVSNPDEVTIKLVSDTEVQYKYNEEVICTADWELLGMYYKTELKEEIESKEEIDENVVDKPVSEMKYIYFWPWVVFKEKYDNIKEILKLLPEELNILSNNVLNLNDPMVISYLMGFLNHHLNLETIYVNFDGNMYSIFGLKNIKWQSKQIYIEEKEEETKKSSTIDWNSIFNLYKKLNDRKLEEAKEEQFPKEVPNINEMETDVKSIMQKMANI